MKTLLEYALVCLIGLGIVVAVITPAVHSVAASMQHSADIIAHPELASQDQ